MAESFTEKERVERILIAAKLINDSYVGDIVSEQMCYEATVVKAEAERDKYKAVVDALVTLASNRGLIGAIRLYRLRAEASIMKYWKDKRLMLVAALENLPSPVEMRRDDGNRYNKNSVCSYVG